MSNTTKEADALIFAAERATAALEGLPVGEPFAEPHAGAQDAVAALRARAAVELFPGHLEEVEDAVLRDFELMTRDPAPVFASSEPVDLVRQHAQAYPELRAVIRGPRGQQLVEAALLARVVADPPRESRAAAEARTLAAALPAWQRAIAAQLVESGELLPWSRVLAEQVPAFADRIETAVDPHRHHAADELARLEREDAEAAASVRLQRAAEREARELKAKEADRAKLRAEREARRIRAEDLAAAVERVADREGTVRLEHGSRYDAAHLAQLLRQNSISEQRIAVIEQLLEGRRGAA